MRVAVVLCALSGCGWGQSKVDVAKAPGKEWVPREVRTLAALPALPVDGAEGKYGGRGAPDPALAKGYFQTRELGGRWWLIDPEGRRFIHQAVASVRPVQGQMGAKALKAVYGTQDAWAEQTVGLLRKSGFNGTGGWSEDEALGKPAGRMAYTKIWNFMSSYGKKRGGTYQKPGHTGYPSDCPFIFDPEFPAFCVEHAQQMAAVRDDPWLLGYFTDNELPWSRSMLERYLGLAAADPGRLAAEKWLRARRGAGGAGGAGEITDGDRGAFLEYAVETYFAAVCRAIRAVDPNHLILGDRLHGPTYVLPEVFRAQGRHVDVVSVNYYHAWTPDPALMAAWEKDSGKPFLITEWYAKGADSGMGNTGGAGWLVKTQRDRGLYYQNFTLGLLECRGCVGWHWFRYADNAPDDKKSDPSNRDSNKGIVSNRFSRYQPLLDSMKELNERSFGLVEHFDRTPAPQR